MRNVPIGQYLVENGYITQEQLDEALAKKAESKSTLKMGDFLISQGIITDVKFAQALASKNSMDFVDLDNEELDSELVRKIPEATARKYVVIAYTMKGTRLKVATSEPFDFYMMEDLRVLKADWKEKSEPMIIWMIWG